MAEHLSGGRIQGSSTASPVAGGYVSIDNESASSTSGSLATSIDLLGTNISDSSWVLRFKYNVTGGSNGIGSTLAFGLTDLPYTTAGTQTQKCFGFKISNGEGGATAGAVDMFPAPDELDPQTHIDFSSLPFVRYFELRRLSATGSAQYTLKAYTTSDYTGTPATADRNPAGITGLRYFKIANYTAASNTGGVEGKVTDLKFWNNEQDTTEDPDVDILQSSGSFTSGTWGSVVSPPTSPANGFLATTSYTDEKTTITNVPAGTRYEEVDTRKIFRRKGAAVSLTGLKAYFPMNEASGKLINKASDYGSTDAISNFDLTVTGGTQNTSGKIDKCVSFSGNQKAEAADSNLSDTAFLSNNGAAWTICFWSKVDGLASGGNIEGDQAWFSTTGYGSGENGVMCRVAATVAPPNNPAYTNMQIGTLSDDRVNGTTSANGLESGGAGSGTGWHFIVLQYDDSTGIARQSKDNGAWNNAATGGNLTNTDTPSDKFRIGQQKNNDNNLNGDMEAFSIWNRILTDAEITTLYGNTTDVGQGLAASWKEKGTA